MCINIDSDLNIEHQQATILTLTSLVLSININWRQQLLCVGVKLSPLPNQLNPNSINSSR